MDGDSGFVKNKIKINNEIKKLRNERKDEFNKISKTERWRRFHLKKEKGFFG